MATTQAAYQSLPGGALDLDRSFYDAIAQTAGTDNRALVEAFQIPIRSGKAWYVPAGHVCRILQTDGPQVGDFNVWNAHNPREHFWASRTRQLQSSSISTHDRLWSTLPYLRPMLTFTADTLSDFHDTEGGNVHDLLGTRCDPYVNRMLAGYDFDYHCHSNLTRAIQPFGLSEYDVHDVLNVFQLSGLNQRGEYFMKDCPAHPGDYLEFFAEIDLLVALSACPGGDLSVAMWGPDAASTEEQLEHCHPLDVEVYRIADSALTGWYEPEFAAYQGVHGKHGLQPVPFGTE